MNKELKTPETIAYEKSIRVIDSCVTEKQCDSANLFIGNFFDRFDNRMDYASLVARLIRKVRSLKL